tara:strand:+ start:2175 stop:3152 length:978 start_codon:yes stop_codon:yes gene_type:complete
MQTRSKIKSRKNSGSSRMADTVDDVKTFYHKNPQMLEQHVGGAATTTTTTDPPPIGRGRYMEVVCSSGQQHLGSHMLKHRAYRLFSYPTQNVGFEHEVEWPQTTDVFCWHDGEPFDTVPICIPHCIDSRTKRYAVYGCFCSLNCALKYMHERDPFDSGNSGMHLRHLARTVFGVQIDIGDRLTQAPDAFFLKKFGGHLDIDEFRTKSTTSTSLTTLVPPFINFGHVLEDNATTKTDDNENDSTSTHALPVRHKIRGLRRPKHPQNQPPFSAKKTPKGSEYAQYIDRKKATKDNGGETKNNKKERTSNKRTKKGGLQKFIRRNVKE